MKRLTPSLVVMLALAACGSNPPPPDWPLEAKGSSERAAEAWLSGNSRIEAAEFSRARAEVERTGQVALVARLAKMMPPTC